LFTCDFDHLVSLATTFKRQIKNDITLQKVKSKMHAHSPRLSAALYTQGRSTFLCLCGHEIFNVII